MSYASPGQGPDAAQDRAAQNAASTGQELGDGQEPTLPRARRRAKNLRRILDAAMEAIAADGFDALSMNRLAATLDYTPGALYRYFASRDALLAELLLEVIADIGQHLERAATGRAPLGTVASCARAWRVYADTQPHRFGLIALMLGTPKRVITSETDAARAMLAMAAAMAPVTRALEQAAQQGLVAPGDARERTLLLFAGLQGVLLLRKQATRSPPLVDLERLANQMAHHLLLGFGASAEAAHLAVEESTP